MSKKTYSPYGIISERLIELYAELEKLSTNKHLLNKLNTCIALSGGIEPYIENNTTPESNNLADLSKSTMIHDWDTALERKISSGFLGSQMLCGHVEGQFLKMLVKITKATKILEIGMFSGYSALAMAESLPKDGELHTCEFNPYAIKFAQNAFKKIKEKRIKIKSGFALETLKNLTAEKVVYDLVFIDATKSEYPEYLDIITENSLINDNSLVCIDNTFLQGKVYSELERKNSSSKVMKKFNSDIAKNPKFHTVMLPLRDGFTLLTLS